MGASPRLRSLLLLNVLHYHHSFYSPLLEARYPDQTFAPIHLLGLGWGDCFPSAIIAFDQSSIGSQMEDYLIYDHRLFWDVAHHYIPCFYMPLLDLLVTQTQSFAKYRH